MGRRLVDTYKVPVALLNGAHGGQPIAFFQRNDAAPDDGATNYGRLRQRLVAAGALGKVRGVLWYQGESDNDNAAVHVAGFGALLDDWRGEFGASKYYLHQVRTSPCGNSSTIALRDAQRRLGDSHGVVVLSTTALQGHDGCHYAYAGGYRDLGDQAFATVARDLYGGPAAGVSAPNPASATPAGDRITVRLRTNDPLTVEPGAASDFRVNGAAVTVTAVGYAAGALTLTLSGPATGATSVSYLGHLRSGPVITNATGAGLLAFDQPFG
jgi:Carbohydrate esterase, sialic acid-specific acetylesterase